MRYEVTVQHQGRDLPYSLDIEAETSMQACEAAERKAAMIRDGSLVYLSHYFARKASFLDQPTAAHGFLATGG